MQDIPEAAISDGIQSVSEIAQTSQGIIAGLEPSLSSLGLCANTPVGLIQSILEALHMNAGLPWWGSIAICTIAFRTLMLPLILKGQINTARLNAIRPELEKIQAEMRELANTQDATKKSIAAMKFQKLLKDNNCHPLKVCALHVVAFCFPIFCTNLNKMLNNFAINYFFVLAK